MSNYNNYPSNQADPPAYPSKSDNTFYAKSKCLRTTVAASNASTSGVNPSSLHFVPLTSLAPTIGTCNGGTVYTIRTGDTLYTLAARFGVTVPALLAANISIDLNHLRLGQTICVPKAMLPQPPILISTPFCTLLQPIFTVLPPDADIPIGAVMVRQVAMSTRAYTIVASPLPNLATLGNYNSYLGVLSLIGDDISAPPAIIYIRLVSALFSDQLITWAGTIITVTPPAIGDSAEVRPFNSATKAQGPALLQGNFIPCRV